MASPTTLVDLQHHASLPTHFAPAASDKMHTVFGSVRTMHSVSMERIFKKPTSVQRFPNSSQLKRNTPIVFTACRWVDQIMVGVSQDTVGTTKTGDLPIRT